MPDDQKKRGKPDRSRVSLEQAHERRYWCRKFGCSVRELLLLQRATGSSSVEKQREVWSDVNWLVGQIKAGKR